MLNNDLELARTEGSSVHIKSLTLDRNTDGSDQDRRQSTSSR